MFNFLQSTIPQTFLIFKHFFKLTSANISFNHLLKMYVDSLYLHLYSCPANRFICIIFLREGNENPLQYSCLRNSMDRGVWWAIVFGVTESWTRLSDSHTHCFIRIYLSETGFFTFVCSFIHLPYVPIYLSINLLINSEFVAILH